MSVKDFDIKELAVVVGGALISGYAEGGDAVTIDFNRELASLVVGSDGEAARSIIHDNSAEIRVRLAQSSVSNDTLSSYARSRQTFTLAIKDNNGNTVAAAETAWIKKYPSVSFGDETGSREWTIETDRLEILVGGVS